MAEDTGEKTKQKIVIVDVSSAVKSQAVDRAEEKLTAAPKEVKGVTGFFKKVWKYNLFREYYRQKEISQAQSGIIREGNIFYGTDSDKTSHQNAMSAVMERFQSDLNETVHQEAGEKKEILGDGEREKYVKDEIEKSIKDFAAGKIDEDNFVEERNRIISGLKDLTHKEADSGLMFADNMLEVAKNIRYMVEHGKKLEDLDLDFEVIVGKAKMGVRTEAQFNAIDRLTARISQTKLGSLVNETTVASALSIGYAVGEKLSERLLRSNAAKVGSFGATAVVSGAIAGAKESYRVEEERKKHFRDMAKGRTFNPDTDRRRKRMEEYRYQTMNAADLIAELGDRADKIKDVYNDENVYQLNKILTETEARIKLSDRNKIDLITYSSEKNVEDERLKLDIARAETKVALRDALTKNLGFTKDEVDEYIDRITETKVKELVDGDQGIEQKNKMFRKMKRQRVAGAVVKGTVSGLLIGGVVQEAGAFLREGQEGFVEGLIKGHNPDVRNFTALEFLRLKLEGKLPILDTFFDHKIIIGKNTINLTKGVNLLSDGKGGYNLTRGSEILRSGLVLGPDGNLTPDSITDLRQNGFIADQMNRMVSGKTTQEIIYKVPQYVDQVKKVVGPSTTKETEIGAADFIKSKLGLFTDIHRNIWFDNDTPNVFDKNELRVLWGGVNGSGLTEKGDFVLNIKQMMPDGSYHDGFSIDAQKLMAEGKLKFLMSLSEDTQNKVIELPFNANGDVIINKDSEIAKMFFTNSDGNVRFLGRYAEVGQFLGKNSDGSENFNLLATAVGDGVDKVKVITNVPGVVTETIEKIQVDDKIIKDTVVGEWFDTVYETEIAAPNNYDWEPPLFIPVFGRTPLERVGDLEKVEPKGPKKEEGIPEYFYQSGGSELAEKVKEHLKTNISETLKKDSKAELNQYQEIERYVSGFDKDYADRVRGLADQAGEMNKNNRLSICIPVAGHQEGKNIYKSLENYTYQKAGKNNFEIVLLVNAPITDKKGNPVDFDETPSEIERFMKDHPEINVRVLTMRLKPEEANIGYIRKVLTDAVLVRQHERGEKAKDLIIVSNDADNKGVSPYYVRNFIEKFDGDPKADGFLGQLDWDPESYVKYPAVHVGTRLFQYLSVIGRYRSGRMVSSGANFAYRGSIYAAVGGYVPASGGEDVAVGMSIIEARDGDKKRIQFAGAGASRLYTSSRRSVDAFKKGLAPVEQWDKGFGAFDELRKNGETVGENIDYDDVETLNKLKKEIEQVVDRTISVYEKGEHLGKGSIFYRRALGWLGVEYELNDKNEVVITDMSRLVAGLKEYKKYGVELRDEKSGKTELPELSLESFYEKESKEEPISDGKNGIKINGNGEKYSIKVGDYWVSDREVENNNGSSGIRLAKKDGDENLYVVKETEVEELEKAASLRGGLPGDLGTVESVVKGKVNEEKIQMPEDEVRMDGKVMRFYKAGEFDLESYLAKNNLTEKQGVATIIKVGDALRELHKAGVVYLDLAPSNILIDGNKVKLIDLDGAYYSSDKNNVCCRKSVFGNRFIMAPELFEKGSFFDKSADTYAMGANLYRLTAGKWPYLYDKETKEMTHEERLAFYGEKHKEGKLDFPEGFDPKLKSIIEKAMNPQLKNRYQTADEMMVDLVKYYESL